MPERKSNEPIIENEQDHTGEVSHTSEVGGPSLEVQGSEIFEPEPNVIVDEISRPEMERLGYEIPVRVEFFSEHDNVEVATRVERMTPEGKSLRYSVIDGEKVRKYFPDIYKLALEQKSVAEQAWGGPLVLLPDKIGVNINIVGPGDTQDKHKDRNEVTVLIYLTSNRGAELQWEDPKTGQFNKYITRTPATVGNRVVLVGANRINHWVVAPNQLPAEEAEGKWHGYVYHKEHRITLAVGFTALDPKTGQPNAGANENRDDFLYRNDVEVPNQEVFGSE